MAEPFSSLLAQIYLRWAWVRRRYAGPGAAVTAVLEAAFWGFVGGFALLVGAVAGLKLATSQRVIGLIIGFGAGVLISALAFELTSDAFDRG